MKYYIGADIGTTSTKVVHFDEALQNIDSISRGYDTYHSQAYYAEQDPEEVLESLLQAVEELLERHEEKRDDVAYMAFSSAMHSLILMDEKDQPLTKSILWSDSRAEELVEEFKKREDAETFYQKTGTPLHPMSPFFKLLWFQKNTDLLKRTKKAIGIKEFIMRKLIGEYVVDYSIASATGLFHLQDLVFDEEVLKEISMVPAQFSRPVDVEEIFSLSNPEVLLRTKLPSSCKVLIGGSDGCLANLGGDVTEPYEAAVTLGTSGAVRITSDRILLHPEGKTFCYYLRKGQYVLGGAVNNGGNVLAYLSGLFYEHPDHFYRDLSKNLLESEPGAKGITFIPYLYGERAPYYDGHLSAGFVGITPRAGKKQFIRAAVEGIFYNLKEVLTELERLHGKVRLLKASGGVFENNEMASVLAGVMGREVQRVEASSSSALGAVRLGVEAIRLNSKKKIEVFLPGEEVLQYEMNFKRYQKITKTVILLKNALAAAEEEEEED